jgi:hypothetical protein
MAPTDFHSPQSNRLGKMSGLNSIVSNWPAARRFAARVKESATSSPASTTIVGDSMILQLSAWVGLVTSAYFVYSYLTGSVLDRFHGLLLGLNAICIVFALVRKRRRVIFHDDHILVKRTLSSKKYRYTDITTIDWRAYGRQGLNIFGVIIIFGDGQRFVGEMTDRDASALAYARERVESSGRDTSDWLPVPSDSAGSE